MSRKITSKVLVLFITFAMVAAFSPAAPDGAAYAASSSTAQGIYDALCAEGSAFSKVKEQSEEYYDVGVKSPMIH